MRVALISDIHGNLVSLDAVLADLDRQGVDRVVCLGDVAALGPQPCQVLSCLRALDCPCVMGNHDEDLLRHDVARSLDSWEAAATAWCLDQLSQADLDDVRSFHPMVEIPLAEQAALLCYHGSPRSNTDRILPSTLVGELDEMLAGHWAVVMAGGHNHVQMTRRHRRQYVVDVGSVGAPFEQMPFRGMPRMLPWAEYAIVHWAKQVLDIDLRRVSVDIDAVKQAALTSTMPGRDEWARRWVTPGT